jgi:hypothetical protein
VLLQALPMFPQQIYRVADVVDFVVAMSAHVVGNIGGC